MPATAFLILGADRPVLVDAGFQGPERVKEYSWLGLAAYNGGPGNAQRWRDQFGLDDPDLFVELIPVRETQAYVRLVYGFYGAYRQVYRP